MEDLQTILIIGAIINIIVLIVFFVMAGNVAAIRKELTKTLTIEQYIDKSNEDKFIGNNVEAEKWLMRAIYELNKELKTVKETYSEYYLETRVSEINKKIEDINLLIKDLNPG